MVAECVQARRPGECDAAAGENRGTGRPDPGRGARRRQGIQVSGSSSSILAELSMSIRFLVAVGVAAMMMPGAIQAQQAWNVPGATNEQLKAPPSGPAPRRDLTGVWDAGGAGIGGSGQADARE